MFDKPIDFTKLHKELRSTYKRQLAIKKEYPHKYTSPPYSLWEQDRGKSYAEEIAKRKDWCLARREFDRLSYRMTKLCCILNHAKGKLHMKSYSYLDAPIVDMEWQYNFIDEDAKEFYKEDEQDVAA